MALFAVKDDLGRVEFEYASRIEAVAYPAFARESIHKGPITSAPENYQYTLEAACDAHYVAEGTLYIPNLSVTMRHPFIFQTDNSLNLAWYVALGRGDLRVDAAPGSQDVAIKEYLARTNLGKPKQRNELASDIAQKMEQHFLPFVTKINGKQGYCSGMIAAIKERGEADYQQTLEQHLVENPQKPILPQKYRYEIDGNIFDKEKLVRV